MRDDEPTRKQILINVVAWLVIAAGAAVTVIALAGCATEHGATPDAPLVEGPTLGDAVEIAARGACERMAACQPAQLEQLGGMESCVAQLSATVLGDRDPLEARTEAQLDEIAACVEARNRLACVTTFPPPSCAP